MHDMDSKINKYFCELMILAKYCENEKEKNLINALDELLSQASKTEPLNDRMLSITAYKLSRVSCFSEKYMHMINFLDEYHKNPGQALTRI